MYRMYTISFKFHIRCGENFITAPVYRIRYQTQRHLLFNVCHRFYVFIQVARWLADWRSVHKESWVFKSQYMSRYTISFSTKFQYNNTYVFAFVFVNILVPCHFFFLFLFAIDIDTFEILVFAFIFVLYLSFMSFVLIRICC